MIYGVILAAGVGKRTGKDIPKQFIKIEDKEIILYTIEAFLNNQNIDKIYVAISSEYHDYVETLLSRYFSEKDLTTMRLVIGGEERIDTILNVQNAIIHDNAIMDDDIVMFHDAVRPFIPDEVINDSIEGARIHKAVVAGLKVVDTVLYSDNGIVVNYTLDRSKIYYGQAPDTFNLKYFIELSEMLTEEQKKCITGTSQVCTFNNRPIYITKGSEYNFKITTAEDLEKAKIFVKERKK